MKQHGKAILAATLILAALAAAFYFGGNAPGLKGWKTGKEAQKPVMSDQKPADPADSGSTAEAAPPGAEEEPIPLPAPSADPEPARSDPAPVTEPTPVQPVEPMPEEPVQPEEPSPAPAPEPAAEKTVCTISISCATLLEHLDVLSEDKAELVPADGWILPPTEVEFDEGDSVFDLLKRVTREKKIHLEFTETPLYGSVYVEGISNLYEFDCGEQSGWMYAVNDWFPNYGCSKYPVENGDVIRWVYTCDLGADVGGSWDG
ncbi:MAG: DUF4430 domain-containing protein [Clostridia bacterium]|nr:DUF4430 domain-containing protein [Clostridia bacterium]